MKPTIILMKKKTKFYPVALLVVILTVYFLFAFFLPVQAQKVAEIKGRIIDQVSRTPVANVNIYFNHSDKGGTTDENGYFMIRNIPVGNDVLIVQHIGYTERRISIALSAGQQKQLDILLIPKVLAFDEVVFSASRHVESIFQSHQDVAIATQENITTRISPNTADALREIPGVLVQKTTAGHGAPIIRGMIGKDVLLLYNGIRLNKPTFRFGANQYMNTIDVESLNRIEITKGPGSMMYGSDAIGGIVNMISEPPHIEEMSDKWISILSSRYGSADESRILHTGLAKKEGRLAFSSGITVKKIGHLTAGKNVGTQNPTGYDEWNATLRMGVKINDATYIDTDFLTVQQKEVPRYDKYVTGDYETYLYDPQDRYLAAVTLRSQPAKSKWINSVRWNFSYQFEKEGTVARKTNSPILSTDRNDLTTYGSYLQICSIWRNNHVLTYGYEIYRDRVKSSGFDEENGVIETKRGNFPDGSIYRSLGFFLNDNFVVNTNFDLTLGVRWSQIHLGSQLNPPFGKFTDNYSDITETVGFSYKPAAGINLIGTYAKGFRAPNFNDVLVLKVSNAGIDAPSSGLKPEKSHNFELGIKLDRSQFSGSMFVFYNRLQDLIDRYRGTYNGLPFYDRNSNGVQDEGEEVIYQKRNVAEAYISGWEFSGSLVLTHKWSLHGFTFWTYGQNITFDEPMSRIPPLMGMAAVRYQPIPKLSIETYIRAATKQDRLSTRDEDDSRIPAGGTPEWITLNFRCIVEVLDNFLLNLSLGNVFDETYKEHGSGVYSPGRNMVIGLRYIQ